jgi:hypothetical protein
MQSASSPYSFPRGGGYTIADPMTDMSVVPLPPPGHSIPLNPSPRSAPPPPPSELSPVPPAPGDPVNSRDATGDNLSMRPRSSSNPARNSQTPIVQSAIRRSNNQNAPSVSPTDAQLGAPMPLARVSPSESTEARALLAPGHSVGSGIPAPSLQSIPLPLTDQSAGAANGSRSINLQGMQSVEDRETAVQAQRYPTDLNRYSRSRRQPAGNVNGDLDSSCDTQTTFLPPPQRPSSGASVPVMLPPGS